MKTWTLHIPGDAHLGVGHPIIAEVNSVHDGDAAVLGQLKVNAQLFSKKSDKLSRGSSCPVMGAWSSMYSSDKAL